MPADRAAPGTRRVTGGTVRCAARRTAGRIGRAVLVGAGLLAVVAGCGFINAGNDSPGKPDGIQVRGRVVVPLLATAAPGSPAAPGPSTPPSAHAGGSCLAPPSMAEIVPGALVTVDDENGRQIGTGRLGPGVVAQTGPALTCDFPFQVNAVPGNHQTYRIGVAGHPAHSFAVSSIRQNQPAIIDLAS